MVGAPQANNMLLRMAKVIITLGNSFEPNNPSEYQKLEYI